MATTETLEKYNGLLALVDNLKSEVEAMTNATSIKNVEEIDLKTRKIINEMTLKLPYVQNDIHHLAGIQRAEIIRHDSGLGE